MAVPVRKLPMGMAVDKDASRDATRNPATPGCCEAFASPQA